MNFLPSSSQNQDLHRENEFCEILYRYAEDLHTLAEQQQSLSTLCGTLANSSYGFEQARQIFEALVINAQELHIVTDLNGDIQFANTAAKKQLLSVAGQPSDLDSCIAVSSKEIYLAIRQRVITTSLPNEGRLLHLKPGGPPFACRCIPLCSSETSTALYWILESQQFQLAQTEKNIGEIDVFADSRIGVLITDTEGRILSANPSFCQIVGYPKDELLGQTPQIFQCEEHNPGLYGSQRETLRTKGTWRGAVQNKTRVGTIIENFVIIDEVHDVQHRRCGFIAAYTNLLDIDENQENLRQLAYHDWLTKLPNRLLFEDRLKQLQAQADRSGSTFALLFIDLDGFKNINDTHGHLVGDLLLRTVAGSLREGLRVSDTIARWAGDEFVILATGIAGDTELGKFCDKILKLVTEVLHTPEADIQITASVGCAEYPRHGKNDALLLRNADLAMYEAKHSGKNCYQIFASDD